MCSGGVSVWFACKLCKSFFLNADDFAYHKKKSHVQEFRNTKFIVFEEQISPPASPPENWVSFLSPKEETRIHKIISLPLPSPSTSTNVDCSPAPANENGQCTLNEELVELIDLESNTDCNVCDDALSVSKTCFELNCGFNSNSDTEKTISVLKKDSFVRNIAPTSTAHDVSDQMRANHFPAIIEPTLRNNPNSLKRRRRKNKNSVSLASNTLRTVIQTTPNPYVQIKRLKAIQNASSQCNSTVYSQENGSSDTNHDNSIEYISIEPKVIDRDQEMAHKSHSTVSLATLKTSKVCSENFNSATEVTELDVHESNCSLRKQFENIICAPCLLTFGSSGELNAHNQTLHSGLFSQSDVTKTQTSAVERKSAQKTKIAAEVYHSLNPDPSIAIYLPLAKSYDNSSYNDSDVWAEEIPYEASDNNTDLSNDPLSTSESILPDVFETDVNVCKNLHNPKENQQSNIHFNQNLISAPSTRLDVSYGYGDLLDVRKTEYTDPSEDSEFIDADHDPFESGSRVEVESSAEEHPHLNVATSSSNVLEENHEKLSPKTGVSRYCFTCKKYFASPEQLKIHNQAYHMTNEGTLRFNCPHLSCAVTTRDQCHLRIHLLQVHSNARPYKCPHPSCTKSFKSSSARNRHFKFKCRNKPT